MKAEHRKDLNTNVLADRMGRLVQGVKSGSGGKSAIVWVIGGLAVATLIGWYIANIAGARGGAAWVQINNSAGSPPALEAVSLDHAGTIAARTAQFQRARILLRLGLSSIYSNVGRLPSLDAHDQAQSDSVENLQTARKIFDKMISECYEDPVLQQEALMGAAKAEEALVGVPKADNADEGIGSLDTALSLYARLRDTYPTTELGKEAAARCTDLEVNRTAVVRFYDDFRKSAKSSSPFMSPFSPQRESNP